VATARGVNAAALLSCDEVDVVVAARSASFLGPFDAHVHRQATALGMHRPGTSLGAAEAARWGLVWRCVPDEELGNRARSVAEGLAGSNPQPDSIRRFP
jgi:2-(1,2-epoxy-1,2-dihydrophenyl)acetyl-CoA isomerase